MPYSTGYSHKLWLASVDALLLGACYVGAVYALLEAGADLYLFYENGGLAIAIVICVILLGIHLQALYVDARIRSRVTLALRLTSVLGFALLAEGLIQYIDRDIALPLPMMLLGSALALGAIFLWRMFYCAIIARGFGPESVLLVGISPVMRAIGERISAVPDYGLVLAGYVHTATPPGTELEGAPVLGALEELPEICRKLRPERIIAEPQAHPLPPALARRIADAGVVLEKPGSVYEMIFGRVWLGGLDPAGWLFENEIAPAPMRLAAQSVYTNVLAISALLVLAVPFACIALLIRLTSPGSVLEPQSVVGWNLIPFNRFRFRCTEIAGGKLTRVGRWLRRLHLDDIPQLVNVLRGEMALVGPSPVPEKHAEEIIEKLPYFRQRFLVKPGIASWAGINMKPPADVTVELEYDLYYIKYISPSLDVYIGLRTLGRLLRSQPA